MKRLNARNNSGIFFHMKRVIVGLFVSCVFISQAFTLEPGNDSVYNFFSPDFLATGPSVTSTGSPYSDILNPSASGAAQRVTVDGSYLGIAGSDAGYSGYGAHAVNLGLTVPSRYGVFSGSGHFFFSEYEELGKGGLGLINASFAKDVSPELLVGAGLSVGFGTEGFFETGLSLGFLHYPQYVDFLKDFRWGASFTNLGYVKELSNFPYSSPLTLTAGMGGALIKSEDFVLDVHGDLGFPAFQNVSGILGAELSFKDFLSAGFATRIDAREISDGDYSSLVPSFGISVTLKTEIKNTSEFLKVEERGWSRSEIRTTLSAVPLADGLWGFGGGVNMPLGVIDKAPPEILIDIGGLNDDVNQGVSSQEGEKLPSEEEKPVARIRKGEVKRDSGKAAAREISLSGGRKDASKAGVKSVQPSSSEKKIVKYISPNNDGVKDDIVIPLSIKDSRYIKGWVLTIADDSGNPVRQIQNKDERPENQGVSGFFERLFTVKSGITVPESIRWDGTTNDGSTVPDGTYWFFIESWDDNGNVGKTPQYGVVVDNTPPEIIIEPIEPQNLIFSPNGDGNKDSLEIRQSGSVEDEWKAVFSGADGKAVRSFVYANGAPSSFVWDGKDDSGALSLDGVYGYDISAVDRAGNKAGASIANIILNTEETPIRLTIDRSYFSPGKGLLSLIPEVPNKNGIDTWSLSVVQEGEVFRSFSGAKLAPERISFDGRDNEGSILKEGTYSALLRVSYKNGNSPETSSPRFSIDLTPPQVIVTADSDVFSPNGDGNKDTVTIYQETSLEDTWTGSIRSDAGTLVREFSWIEKADAALTWDGRGADGLLLPDGSYTYTLESVDRAGNRGVSKPVAFVLDTEETPVILSVEADAFSPNADGIKDTIRILPEVKKPEGIESYSLSVLNAGGESVRTYTGRGKLPSSLVWDGLSDRGLKAPDGNYRAELRVRYVNGNEPKTSSKLFLIDTVYPSVKAAADAQLFSPEGDGYKDVVTITHESSEENLWEGLILDAALNPVKQQFFKGRVPDILWDGLDDAGNRVPDGSYRWVVRSTDIAGNSGKAEVGPIRIDTRIPRLFVTTDVQAFSPNGDGRFEDISFTPVVTLKEGFSSWNFDIVDGKGTPVWRQSGTDRLPELIRWNGKNDSGRIAEGEYRARFAVTYEKGNRPEVTSVPFILDVSPPEISLSLSPKPFSPDNDGIEDELAIRIGVRDASRIESWNLKIFDPQKSFFTEFAGAGSPAERIIWDGKGRFGELVYSAEDYPLILTVQDVLGNTAVARDTIPVDVLVLREGDKLKIKIANINFAPNKAEFVTDDPAIVERNSYVLKRLAVILNKYRGYRVTIEGHAVITKFADPKAAEKEQNDELLPLSKARAETVRNELINLGVSKDRLNVVGLGGASPLVPHSDLENRWKNRRVEFILEK